MSLPALLINYLNDQIAAGLSVERLQGLVREVIAEWEADPDEVVQYLYDRLRDDVLLWGILKLAFARGVSNAELPLMSPEMDSRIRRSLFNTKPLPTLPTRLKPPEACQSMPVDTHWTSEGPFISSISWKVSELQRLWDMSISRAEVRSLARKYMMQWRAIERVMHLDFTALQELQAWHEAGALDPEIVEQLRQCRTQMLDMAKGVQDLLESVETRTAHG